MRDILRRVLHWLSGVQMVPVTRRSFGTVTSPLAVGVVTSPKAVGIVQTADDFEEVQ